MLDLLPHLINGLTLGLLFALIALGFMLIVGVMEQINLAHGSLFALGAYVALVLLGPKPPLPPGVFEWWLAQPMGLRYALAFLVAPLVVGIVGIPLELAMRRTYGKDPLYGLLLTFGAAMVIEEAIRLIWGTRDYVLPIPPGMSRRLHRAGPDLVVLSLLRRRHRGARHLPDLALHREDALRRDHQGRRA